MKSYTITVNGVAYDVVVEEKGGGSGTAPASEAPQAAAAAPVQSSGGGVKITASVPGKVFKVAVKPGQAVKAGDTVVILESMKMEIPVVAPQEGTIVTVDTSVGSSVENGDTLATMN